jgi:tellurite methyltransferase
MRDDRIKWNRRYAGGSFYMGPEPSGFLLDKIALISSLTAGRKALDIACGEGRNSLFLARHGFSVTGLDISEEGVTKAKRWAGEEGLEILFRRVDLEKYSFSESYDLIINFNFLLRPLIPEMVEALNGGGVIVFDTILDTPALAGNHNREFLLAQGELRSIFSGLPGEIILCEELPEGPIPTARLIFRANLPASS